MLVSDKDPTLSTHVVRGKYLIIQFPCVGREIDIQLSDCMLLHACAEQQHSIYDACGHHKQSAASFVCRGRTNRLQIKHGFYYKAKSYYQLLKHRQCTCKVRFT